MSEYGYTRVSKPKQRIERQISNILREYPKAIIIKEIHTRTKIEGRVEWAKLMRRIKPGDTIVFDSVSRMSGNEEEGFAEYKRLYEAGIELVFLKEPHINTATYKAALAKQVEMTGTMVDYILQGVNTYLLALAEEQIRLAFLMSEKEVTDLRQRTKEGVQKAKEAGKTVGRPANQQYQTKKSVAAKEVIRKHSKTFGGSLSDDEVILLAKVNRKTYYKYKKEILLEMKEQTEQEDI